MNWQAIGAISEAFSAIVVAATLVYVVRQIHHLRQQTILASFQHTYDAINQFDASIAQSDEVAALVVRGRASMSGLSPSEKLRFEHLFGRLLNIVESWHFQILETAPPGGYRDEQLKNIANFVRTRCDHPGVLEFWNDYQQCYDAAMHRLMHENTGAVAANSGSSPE
ncbi:hypothetical protein [Rhodanobacter sp. L36]|uniref:hypothetical protein n=1 Tax=Rhodanobacter sp. L36 TaxID=1747221 RepID=UPI00131CE918|nr:hypothetical protein [Rhodanobacter sp. L36]